MYVGRSTFTWFHRLFVHIQNESSRCYQEFLKRLFPDNVSLDSSATSSQWVERHELALQQVRASSESQAPAAQPSEDAQRLQGENQRYKEVLASTVRLNSAQLQ